LCRAPSRKAREGARPRLFRVNTQRHPRYSSSLKGPTRRVKRLSVIQPVRPVNERRQDSSGRQGALHHSPVPDNRVATCGLGRTMARPTASQIKWPTRTVIACDVRTKHCSPAEVDHLRSLKSDVQPHECFLDRCCPRFDCNSPLRSLLTLSL